MTIEALAGSVAAVATSSLVKVAIARLEPFAIVGAHALINVAIDHLRKAAEAIDYIEHQKPEIER